MSGEYVKQEDGTEQEVFDITSLGEGLSIASRKIVEFTHKRASQLLEMKEFVGDRKLKQRHVDVLVHHMKSGTFHSEHVQLMTCYCEETKEEYRINGQHTAWARLEMPSDWPCKVTTIQYSARKMEDVRRLYATVDRGSPRSRRNVIDSYLSGTSEFGKYGIWSVRNAAVGLNTLLSLKKSTSSRSHAGRPADDIAYMMLTEWLDASQEVCELLDTCVRDAKRGSSTNFMHRAIVVAAIFATWEFVNDADDATFADWNSFWCSVRDGLNFESLGDPRRMLRNYLAKPLTAGLDHGDQRMGVELAAYDACIRCWNAWRKGQEVARIPLSYRPQKSGEIREIV